MRIKRIRKRSIETAFFCLFIAGAVFCLFESLQLNGKLEILEMKAYDLWVYFQPQDTRVSDKIVVVNLQEGQAHARGWDYPLNDAHLMEVLDKIVAMKPACLGIDLFREHESGAEVTSVIRKALAQADQTLKQATTKRVDVPALGALIGSINKDIGPDRSADLRRLLMRNSKIKVVARLGNDEHRVPPPPVFLSAPRNVKLRRVAMAAVSPDRDGIARRAEVYCTEPSPGKSEPDGYYSLAVLMADEYLGSDLQCGGSGGEIRFGEHTFPSFDPSRGCYFEPSVQGVEMLLDFRGGSMSKGVFNEIPMNDILNGTVSPKAIEGKIVFLGTAAVSSNDFGPTPVLRDHSGVQVQAAMCDQLLRSYYFGTKPVSGLTRWGNGVWLAFWCGLAGLVGAVVRGPGKFAMALSCGLIATTIGAFSFFLHGVWLPFAAPSLGWFTSAAITTSYMAYRERSERGLLKTLFDRHVDPQVADKIWESRDELLDAGHLKQEKVIATVLFTDMVGFSTVSENFHDPGKLIQWLDEYMSAMSQLVLEEGGMVNKYIGDSIMAVFGVPISHGSADDARRALRCALKMRPRLVELNKGWRERNIPEIGMRVGIATGWLVAGSLGSARRLEYTVIGDIVNTASRLEGVAKEIMPDDVAANNCRILLAGPTVVMEGRTGESTWELAHESFELRRMLDVEEQGLKGMAKEIEIYGAISERKSVAETKPAMPAPVVEAPIAASQPLSEVTS